MYAGYVTTHLGEPDYAQAAPPLKAHICAHLPTDRRARILDLGCGSGLLIQVMRNLGYSNVTGVDGSPEQVGLARRRGIEGIEEGQVVDYLARRPESFDAILAIDLLEHFTPPEVLEVADLIRAALVPGGLLIVRSPNADGPFGSRPRYWDFTHHLAFTPQSVRQALETVGFTDVSVYPTTPVAHGLKSAVRLLLWRALSSLLRLYLATETGVARGHILTQNLVAVARR
jgi:cyclopropane fatty-acyl-phospholipid synthase-like methyltransferase